MALLSVEGLHPLQPMLSRLTAQAAVHSGLCMCADRSDAEALISLNRRGRREARPAEAAGGQLPEECVCVAVCHLLLLRVRRAPGCHLLVHLLPKGAHAVPFVTHLPHKDCRLAGARAVRQQIRAFLKRCWSAQPWSTCLRSCARYDVWGHVLELGGVLTVGGALCRTRACRTQRCRCPAWSWVACWARCPLAPSLTTSSATMMAPRATSASACRSADPSQLRPAPHHPAITLCTVCKVLVWAVL